MNNNVDFRIKNTARYKESHFIMKNRSIHQEGIIVLDINIHNKRIQTT